MEQTSQDGLAHAAAMVDRMGLFSCPQTAVVLTALPKLAERGLIGAQDRLLVLSTANGLNFIDFKIGHHQEDLPAVEPKPANKPVELPGHIDLALKAVASAAK